MGMSAVAVEAEGQSLKSRLRNVFTQRKIATAGSVQLFGLSALREKIGARWDAVSDKVHMLIERLLKGSLTSHDAWFRYGEEDYIIVFAKLDRAAAQLICGKLAEQLHQQLLGDADLSTIQVRSVVFDIDGDFAVESTPLSELLSDAADVAARTSRTPIVAADQTKRAETRAAQANDAFVFGFPTGTPQQRRAKRMDALQAAVNRHFSDQPSRVVFRPIWDAQHQVISTFKCVAARKSDRYNPTFGYDLLSDPEDSDAIFDLDCDTLAKTMMVSAELYPNNFRYVSGISVHFETLASPRTRNEYTELLKVIPRNLSQFVDFFIHGLPVGVPLSRAIEMKTLLKPHCRTVFPIIDIDERIPTSFTQAGYRLIGTRLSPAASEGEGAEKVRSFALNAKRNGMMSYVGGIRSSSLFLTACESGVGYMSGAFFGADSEYPQHMRRCRKHEMLAMADNRPTARYRV